MLEKLKLVLRIKNTAYDTEIQSLINSCKADLSLAGVNSNKTVKVMDGDIEKTVVDPLIEQAILLYCKWNFGYDENSERFKESYIKLKIALALSIEYEVE
ncbi:MAG TPA: DNA-packaging protein [Lachnoclostridium phytofermentans]|uniref:DNA-packaging protein n=1 Tax=Lachnoclostridium phytofermentans TaxID=66219 RepID=A0A3D2X9T8_9FIRM|nr:head-tail connector protein [Lachnoclostridium sp.]HCL03882.1 DNA-packaging protein [Lachnoclostridium phytofermentans]